MVGPRVIYAVFPVIGAALARRDLRLPFAVGSAFYLLNIAAALAALPETCQADMRVPFTVRGSNPLTFVKLFRAGPRLSSDGASHGVGASAAGAVKLPWGKCP